ncbi:Hint domain-containing protein [Pacificibacter marinus]|uniref:Hom_end-associated Hint n=1 Tax=Pacificibacter marinus TaxID=658057 RepID=A0A1Y5SNG1_9RHOB|nr:Hint domain-containing protein [Pacificibacter marinus]SEK71050.1 Hint domain-containing protein [Pacificibacter marinus]SLN44606.1 Hom_end-associated Hint [Pacificibacter marinus]
MIETMFKTPSQISLNTGVLQVQSLPVYHADSFRVNNGANFGDAISQADEIELADIYQLETNAKRLVLAVNVFDDAIRIAEGSDIGQLGADIHLDCVITLMAPDGATVEVLILIETDDTGMIEGTYILPLAALHEKQDYAAVMLDRDAPRARLAEVSCVSFTRSTLITMANGMQKPIEDLNIGDRILTRDNGPREIRWIGQQTVRATGSFAPIIIKKGALNNENDLTVSPNHRIFIYQRKDRVHAKRAEILVKAKLLVNGVSVVQSDGGFVEYYQLLFDKHEIIYAEGIAAESMFVDTQVKPYLPKDIQARMSNVTDIHEQSRAFEITDGALAPEDAANLLRAASGT